MVQPQEQLLQRIHWPSAPPLSAQKPYTMEAPPDQREKFASR
jgi:hypothetical protein